MISKKHIFYSTKIQRFNKDNFLYLNICAKFNTFYTMIFKGYL